MADLAVARRSIIFGESEEGRISVGKGGGLEGTSAFGGDCACDGGTTDVRLGVLECIRECPPFVETAGSLGANPASREAGVPASRSSSVSSPNPSPLSKSPKSSSSSLVCQ
jgi:hypothetical protein